jgi:tight adherence protein B
MFWLLFALVGVGLWLVHDSLLPAQPRAPRRPSRTFGRLRDWLVQTGVPITPRLFLLVSAGGALLGGILAHLLLGGPLFDAVGIALGGSIYPLVLHSRHGRKRQAVLRSLPEAIDRLRDSLASNIPMDVALAHLGTDAGPEPLRPTFRHLANELRLGATFTEAVQHWADGLADRTADWVGSALILHNQVGAERFGMCLDQLASSLRTQLALREQVDAARAKIVMQARILLVLPVVVLLGLRISQPIASQAFDTATGQLVLVGAVVALTAGYALMLWLARVPSDEREVAR